MKVKDVVLNTILVVSMHMGFHLLLFLDFIDSMAIG